MDREGFRNRLKQYKLAREENPGLKYWEWKNVPKYDEGTDGVRDNTYVAPIEKEQVFIPATGATKLKLDIRNKITRNGQIKSGAVDIVSPEFEILTVAAGPIKKATSKLLLNVTNKIDDSLKYSGRFSQPSTNDKLYEIYNSKLAGMGSFEDYKNYVATIFPDSKLKDVYYHGGAKNIKLFKDFGDAVTTSNVGAKHGIYFTPQKEYAQHTRGQRVLSVDANNKQRSIISSLKTRYTPGKLDKLIEDETELYGVLLNSLNPLITKGNWTWAIDDKKYGELLEKGYDAVENKGQSLFLNINKLPETIVWDPLNVHILGNTEDIAGFEKYLKGYAEGGEVIGPPTETEWRKSLIKDDLWMHPDYYMSHSLNMATDALKQASANLPGRNKMPVIELPIQRPIKGDLPYQWTIDNLYDVENPYRKGINNGIAKMYDDRTLGAGVDVKSGHPELYGIAKKKGIKKDIADKVAYNHVVHDDEVIRNNFADIYGKDAADTLSFGSRLLVSQARYQLGNVRDAWEDIHKAMAAGDENALKKAVLKVTPEGHEYRRKWVKDFNVYGNEPE